MIKHCVRLCLALGFGLLLLGCQPNLGVPEGNRVPTADARVMGKEGQNVTVDYMGMPVRITLDGSFSKDLDGSIKKYRWLSGKRKPGTGGAAGGGGRGGAGGSSAAGGGGGAAGMASDDADGGTAGSGGMAGSMAGAAGFSAKFVEQRWVPPGAPDDWPDDVVQPVVELPEGEWAFVLWVEDDRGTQSMPSTLKISVRTPLTPEVQMCVDTVYEPIASACKTCLCGLSDQCRMNSAASVCGAECWALLSCIASKCPNFRSGDPASTMCLTSNCLPQLVGNAAMGATAIGPCVTMCPTQCRSQ
jgi:hypothetical protein